MKVLFTKVACAVAMTCLPVAAMADSVLVPVVTEHAPKALGSYTQAIQAGPFLFISGQIGIDPATGKLAGPTVEEQTKQVIANIQAILAEQGMTLENVCKSEVCLKNLADFQKMNGVYAEAFSHAVKPARSTFEISRLPLEALVKISCIAYQPEAN